MDLLQKSEDLKKDADLIIRKTRIKDILKKLGKVIFVGSYALNLLYRPDIDIFIQSKNCLRKRAIKITKVFLDSGLFQTVGFADWTKRQPPNGPSGFYWELIHYSSKYKWKFDVWYTSVKNIETIEIVPRILKKLKNNPDAQRQILRLKGKYFDGIKYYNDINSREIYEQVLGKI